MLCLQAVGGPLVHFSFAKPPATLLMQVHSLPFLRWAKSAIHTMTDAGTTSPLISQTQLSTPGSPSGSGRHQPLRTLSQAELKKGLAPSPKSDGSGAGDVLGSSGYRFSNPLGSGTAGGSSSHTQVCMMLLCCVSSLKARFLNASQC